MSHLDDVINWSKKLETALEKHLGAEGRGLHEKTSSVEHRLDAQLVKLLRRIATIRNKAVHEDGYKIPDINRFVQDCDTAHKRLLAIGNGKPAQVAPVAAAKSGDTSLSERDFSYSLNGIAAFILRELAFLAGPLLLLTKFRALKYRALELVVAFILFVALLKTMEAIVLQPIGWMAWLGVALGLIVSVVGVIVLLMAPVMYEGEGK